MKVHARVIVGFVVACSPAPRPRPIDNHAATTGDAAVADVPVRYACLEASGEPICIARDQCEELRRALAQDQPAGVTPCHPVDHVTCTRPRDPTGDVALSFCYETPALCERERAKMQGTMSACRSEP